MGRAVVVDCGRRVTMDDSHDPRLDDDGLGEPPARDEASIRAMLEQSRRDILAGRVVALEPVLERMRAMIERPLDRT